jgi:hypothetical protein
VAHNDNENELDAALRAKLAEVKAQRLLAEMPPAWFVEPLMALAVAIVENTATGAGQFSVSVSSELGLRLGIAPGEKMQVHTAAGYVTVASERSAP